MFEDESASRPKLKRTTNLKKHGCESQHKSFDRPTVKRKAWCRSATTVDAEDHIATCSAGSDIGRSRKKAKLGIVSCLGHLFQEKEK